MTRSKNSRKGKRNDFPIGCKFKKNCNRAHRKIYRSIISSKDIYETCDLVFPKNRHHTSDLWDYF
jgi:hypothetical protein